MNENVAKQIMDKIVGQVFGYQNPLTLEQFQAKFAFDVRTPQQVYDSLTNEPTWAASTNPSKFISFPKMLTMEENAFERPKRPIGSIEDILKYWQETNMMASERYLDSVNVAESDDVRFSENIYRAQDIEKSKNIIFSESITNSEFLAASQRSQTSSFSIRLEDSNQTSNSFSVSWSTKISNSLFIQNSNNMIDCMFCSHLSSKQFWIANMPFEEAEYRKIKDMVVRWILTG